MADSIVIKKEKEEDTCNIIPSLKNEKEVSFKRFCFPIFLLLGLDHLNCIVFAKQKMSIPTVIGSFCMTTFTGYCPSE